MRRLLVICAATAIIFGVSRDKKPKENRGVVGRGTQAAARASDFN